MPRVPESVAAFLRGRRFAVAGVSRDTHQPANAIFRKMQAAGYEVFPINPRATTLEGTACYADVAAVPGPLDVIGDAAIGVLDEDLRAAALQALTIDRAACRAFASRMTWDRCARMFLDNVAILRRGAEAGERRPAPAVSSPGKVLTTT